MREILSFQFHSNKKHPTALLIIDFMNKHRMSPYNSAISIFHDEMCYDYDDFCDWQSELKSNNHNHLFEYEPFAFIDHVWTRLRKDEDHFWNAMLRFWDIELGITRDMIIANRCKPGPSGRRHWEFIGRKLDRKLPVKQD